MWPSGAVYDLPIDLLKDLEPVGLISTQPFMIVGRKTLPREQSQGADRLAQGQSGQATFGNAGIGSPGHVSSIFFQNTIGAKIQPVPYRSAGPASQDLIAGNIDLMMDTAATSGPHVRNGLLKAFAMSSNKRSLAMPDVPTVDEAGLPGFYFYFWHALWVPKGTPKDVIAKLNDARGEGAQRSGDAQAARRYRPGVLPRRHGDAGGARQVPEGRDRQVVAGHQGRRHQGAVVMQ